LAEQVDDGLQPVPVEGPCQGEAIVNPFLHGLKPSEGHSANWSDLGGLPFNSRLRFLPGPAPLCPALLADLALYVDEVALHPVGDCLFFRVVFEPAPEDVLVVAGLEEAGVLLEDRLEVAADAAACLLGLIRFASFCHAAPAARRKTPTTAGIVGNQPEIGSGPGLKSLPVLAFPRLGLMEDVTGYILLD